MFRQKKCIAMLLAGGQGSRLGVLTKNVAKPAVHFGGKYRIIDFTLSNCVNSGIDTVGVLTQYKPLELNDYIGNGQPWGLDRNSGGVHILSPYAKIETKQWYTGTANAIYQNIRFIEQYRPTYVLVLSGDHIYKMDYSKMLAYHEEKGADATIAVIDVPIEEASRFGLMNTKEDGQIYEFEEKPAQPKSTKASMGVYIFTWEVLKQYLEADERNSNSDNDFGKNLIPAMLDGGRRLFAYSFTGYWKDVGTIESLWEANMDLLSGKSGLDLEDKGFRVYARNYDYPPTYIAPGAEVEDAMITKGCEIMGRVSSSVISSECTIEKGAVVRDSVILPGAVIRSGAVIDYSIIGEGTVIGEGAQVGGRPQNSRDTENWGITVVGAGHRVKAQAQIAPAQRIG